MRKFLLALCLLAGVAPAFAQTQPTLDFSASPASGTSPLDVTLTWSTTGAATCVASEGWTGTKAISGSQVINDLPSDTSFTLTCSADSVVGSSVTVATQVMELRLNSSGNWLVKAIGTIPLGVACIGGPRLDGGSGADWYQVPGNPDYKRINSRSIPVARCQPDSAPPATVTKTVLVTVSEPDPEEPPPTTRPACDLTITSAAQFTNANVNNAAYRVICVNPGVAIASTITLTANGTQAAPRWLRLNRADSAHPANLTLGETAAVQHIQANGQWWVIDRISVRGSTTNNFWTGSNNIFQFGVFENRAGTGNGLYLNFGGGTNNSVINSVFRTPLRTPGVDSYAVYIGAGSSHKVLGNELISMPNGIQIGPGTGGGHVVSGNEHYYDSTGFANSSGALDPNGAYQCGEGFAFVAKGTGTAQSFIEENFAWNFSEPAPNCSGSGSPGTIFNLGSGNGQTNNYTMRNNTAVGRITGSVRPTYGFYLGLNVSNNIVSDNYIANTNHPLDALYAVNSTVTNNVISNNLAGSCVLTGNGNTVSPTGVNCPGVSGRSTGGTRPAAPGERCVVKYHITNPTPVCLP